MLIRLVEIGAGVVLGILLAGWIVRAALRDGIGRGLNL
jgi:hypothetical protein